MCIDHSNPYRMAARRTKAAHRHAVAYLEDVAAGLDRRSDTASPAPGFVAA
jgi:hypothetical protein